mmetsp:Transcript_58677/g.101055  ORF Transcript_58677/g.101055 Transcript_58677/m.101055 type:complete len:353 (+) Transcript_58677:221-1279(+)
MTCCTPVSYLKLVVRFLLLCLLFISALLLSLLLLCLCGLGLFGGLFRSRFLLFLNVIEHLLFAVLLGEESLLGEGLGLLQRVRDDDVVENAASLDLPQLKPDKRAVHAPHRQSCVLLELRVGHERVHPLALVLRVVDHGGLPRALVLRVGNRGRLPLSVVFVFPVLGLRCLRVRDGGRDVVVALRLHVLRVGDLLRVHPVLGLALGGVLNGLGRESPAFGEFPGGLLYLVEQHLVRAVRLEDERVEVRELVLVVVVEFDVLFLQQVLALVVEDEVDAAHVVPTQVGAEHDGVLVVAAKLGLVDRGQELDVAPTAEGVVLLLVLHRELHYERLRGLQSSCPQQQTGNFGVVGG